MPILTHDTLVEPATLIKAAIFATTGQILIRGKEILKYAQLAVELSQQRDELMATNHDEAVKKHLAARAAVAAAYNAAYAEQNNSWIEPVRQQSVDSIIEDLGGLIVERKPVEFSVVSGVPQLFFTTKHYVSRYGNYAANVGPLTLTIKFSEHLVSRMDEELRLAILAGTTKDTMCSVVGKVHPHVYGSRIKSAKWWRRTLCPAKPQ